MNLTAQQTQKYYETRLPDLKRNGSSMVALCPFHEDHHPSMSVNLEKAVWYCHTEHRGGGVLEFEREFSGCDAPSAATHISQIVGATFLLNLGTQPEATYDYRDEQGRLLFQVLRYQGENGRKKIVQRKPQGKSGWDYSLNGTRRVLYRLEEVIRASEVAIVEGEKCVEKLRGAYIESVGEDDAPLVRGFAVTTNPHGAGKWNDLYAPFFAGKRVAIFPDNDAPGRKHAQQVAKSVSHFAAGVKIVELPGLSDADDVADFLTSHSFNEVMACVQAAPQWKCDASRKLFAPASEFMASSPEQIEWLVDGVIEHGSSGFILGPPGARKSYASMYLAAAMASGEKWFEFPVSRRRVAYCAREDNPATSAFRIRMLKDGMGITSDLDSWLFINTRDQTPSLKLDNLEDVAEFIDALKALRIEFCFLDVLNVLHDKDENDNSEMRQVMKVVEQIRVETGVQVGIVHHCTKAFDANLPLKQWARGASAIGGFAEFILGLHVVDDHLNIMQAKFWNKAAMAPAPFYWKIQNYQAGNFVRFEKTEWEPPKSGAKNRMSAGMGK